MDKNYVEVKSFGEVLPKKGANTRVLYEHQKKAMECLDIIDEKKSYSTLVVLPTGGGKTYTASIWLLKHALDKRKKVLWLAHRQMLLEQAADSFQKYAYFSIIPHISSFRYRIVSGSSTHDKTIDITPNDNLLIVSKDSIGRNIKRLDKWLKNENEIYLIVDEAHHSTAKTYRKVIDYVKSKVSNVKLIGLTATPFRTAESEQGLLSKIYMDGVKDGKIVQGEIGIAYQIGLKDLINRRILSKPIFESYYTEELYGESLGVDAWESIQHLDVLPEGVAGQMADSAYRNKLIVDTYKKNQKEYGQTIVFAINVIHAIHLAALFNKAGIRADYVVSDIRDSATGVIISREKNERTLKEYQKGNIKVLVNVNILTEGVDLPKTKTVFLARPTVSTILMTQMIGRALRGEAAGGTSIAHIVSFIDNWDEHIAWVNPESLFVGVENDFIDNLAERTGHTVRMIAISKIEEYASILDDSVDTTKLERIPFKERIPIGMYVFHYLEENGMDISYQVMVYNSTKEAYKKLMKALPDLFKSFGVESEYLSDSLLNQMEEQCRDTFFINEMIPPYEKKDVKSILKYFAQYEVEPNFYTFEQIDNNKLDIAKIAKKIWDEDMGARRKAEYLDSLWENADDNMMKLLFGRKLYFLRNVEIEFEKIAHADIFEEQNNVHYGRRSLEKLPLYEIRKYNPNMEQELREKAFSKAITKTGAYKCSYCGKKYNNRIYFQVDHIIPINKGGKSIPDNLQILCRKCNGEKGDK